MLVVAGVEEAMEMALDLEVAMAQDLATVVDWVLDLDLVTVLDSVVETAPDLDLAPELVSDLVGVLGEGQREPEPVLEPQEGHMPMQILLREMGKE